MKKAICLLITAYLCLAVLASCKETETKHEISDYDSVSRVAAEENSAPPEASVPPDESTLTEESTPEESSPTADRNDGREPIIAVYEDKPRNITVEIYEESTGEMVKSFEITDRKECNDLYFNFNKCFADACNEYPKHNLTGEDKNYKAEYRVLVRYTTYADEEKTEVDLCAEVCYPYGYTNEIYSIVHFDVFGEYAINNGKNFIDPIDEYVKNHMKQ